MYWELSNGHFRRTPSSRWQTFEPENWEETVKRKVWCHRCYAGRFQNRQSGQVWRRSENRWVRFLPWRPRKDRPDSLQGQQICSCICRRRISQDRRWSAFLLLLLYALLGLEVMNSTNLRCKFQIELKLIVCSIDFWILMLELLCFVEYID